MASPVTAIGNIFAPPGQWLQISDGSNPSNGGVYSVQQVPSSTTAYLMHLGAIAGSARASTIASGAYAHLDVSISGRCAEFVGNGGQGDLIISSSNANVSSFPFSYRTISWASGATGQIIMAGPSSSPSNPQPIRAQYYIDWTNAPVNAVFNSGGTGLNGAAGPASGTPAAAVGVNPSSVGNELGGSTGVGAGGVGSAGGAGGQGTRSGQTSTNGGYSGAGGAGGNSSTGVLGGASATFSTTLPKPMDRFLVNGMRGNILIVGGINGTGGSAGGGVVAGSLTGAGGGGGA